VDLLFSLGFISPELLTALTGLVLAIGKLTQMVRRRRAAERARKAACERPHVDSLPVPKRSTPNDTPPERPPARKRPPK
jgi:hypothetical protein